jgi:predicted nucleic acid-binding protein
VAYYVDTSALAKLVVEEPETAALRAWFAAAERTPVSSDLARTELFRAVRRAAPERAVEARAVLDSITTLEVTTGICEHAARLDPTILRALDAIHLATALILGDDLDGIVTYDERLAAAAAANGVRVVAPT